MTLEIKEVERIAELARLILNSEEKQLFQEQLSEILDYARRLQSIDTTKVPSTSSVLPSSSANSLRSDKSRSGMVQEDLFKNAPSIEDDQFRVPRVLESN